MNHLEKIMYLALKEASLYEGQTSPNPPVGAVLCDESLNVLSTGAHQKAGTSHAEVHAIESVKKNGKIKLAHTLFVTLEPCSHAGRTPPCVDQILSTSIKRVIIGALDPNPNVQGKGAEFLRKKGIEVIEGVLASECTHQLRAFFKFCQKKQPWVVLKTVYDANGSMIPPQGKKTFSSENSLKVAHEYRKRADAILTGIGTVLADAPLFTVRHVEDFKNKKRWLIVLDRNRQTPPSWIKKAESSGFVVKTDLILENVFQFLGDNGVMEVLVEAGPRLTQSILDQKKFDEHVCIKVLPHSKEDEVKIDLKDV